MKKVLVPVDFSSCAENALNFAVQSAKLFPLEICVIHIFEDSDDLSPLRKRELEDKLDMLKLSISETEGISIKTKVLQGLVQATILSEAAVEDVDMIIMGTFGASGVMEELWGSKTVHTINHSSVPGLLIPYDYEWTKPEKMLLATINFEEEDVLLDFIFTLAGLYKAKVELGVFTENDYPDDFAIVEQKTLMLYRQELKHRYPHVATAASQITGHDFPEAMQQHLSAEKIDLLVMITYQKNFIERIFYPSMTRKMSYMTSIPLLAMPARKIVSQ